MTDPGATMQVPPGEADARLADPTTAPIARVVEPGATGASERRTSGRRNRSRDRLLDRGSQPTEIPPGELARVRDIENTLLFIDDDLRETALALVRIEGYLGRTLQTLEQTDIRREHVHALAIDRRVLDHVDGLSETLESLRRRLAKLSSTMK